MVRSTSSSGVRRQDPQLPTNHEGMELHRAPVPPATGNPRRYVEISVGAARELNRCSVIPARTRFAQSSVPGHPLFEAEHNGLQDRCSSIIKVASSAYDGYVA